MKKNIVLLAGAFLLSGIAQAQSEKWTQIKPQTAIADAIFQTQDLMRDIVRTTGCPLEDLTGLLDHFEAGSTVAVSSTRTNEKKNLTPEMYFYRLNQLKCGDDPVYNKVMIKFDTLKRSAITLFVSGDTTFITIQVIQWFEGISSELARSYADRTIKAINYAYYIDRRGAYVGKIRSIEVGPTTKIKPWD